MSLEFEAVRFSVAGGREILRGVSARVEPGEVLAILGPNGAGKSTLLKVLSGDQKPSGGEVRVNGEPLGRMSLAERSRVRAVLPQFSDLRFPFSVEEVARLGLTPFRRSVLEKQGASIVDEALRMAGAWTLRGRNYLTLSGGERRRAQLARALAQILCPGEGGAPSRYLFLDEPTAGLDLEHQHGVLRSARELARRSGAGVVAVLHDLNLAAEYADKVLALKDGQAVSQGTPAQVLAPKTVRKVFAVKAWLVKHPETGLPTVLTSAA